MVTKAEARSAARAKAAAERAAVAKRRRRNRSLVIAGVVAAVVIVGGGVAWGVLAAQAATAAQAAAVRSAASKADATAAKTDASARTTAPPWALPSDVQGAVRSAGLSMLTSEGTALHIHQHLSITVDGKAVTVPADLGIDEKAETLSSLHTHDTSGILHVESPVVTTFHLDQAFAEWGVRLGPGAIGPYRNGTDGAQVAVFVDQKPYTGDPRQIVLRGHEDIDFVVTTNGSTPTAPARFAWPSGY